MKLARTILFSSLVVVSSAAALACGGSVESPPQTTASAVSKAPVGQSTHGAVKVFGDALGDVALRADQRVEIEKLAADAEARHAPMAEGRRDLMNTFAAQIEAGTVDRAALQPKIDRVTADIEKTRADDRAAIVKLHGILDKDQRDDFVDALESRIKGKHGDLEEGGHGPMGGFAKLKQLSDDLKLTDDQKDKIKDVIHGAMREGMKQHHAMRAHHKDGKHALEAFRDDTLDLDKVAPPQDLKAIAKGGVEHVANVADKILPILTPEQRKIAADKVRAMAANGDAAFLVH